MYGANDACDCGCGAPDPDCVGGFPGGSVDVSNCQQCLNAGSCATTGCGDIDPADTGRCR